MGVDTAAGSVAALLALLGILVATFLGGKKIGSTITKFKQERAAREAERRRGDAALNGADDAIDNLDANGLRDLNRGIIARWLRRRRERSGTPSP